MSQIQFNFAQVHALITGGVQGIGYQIALNFLQAGANVTIWDYSTQGLESAKKQLQQFEGRVFFSQVDVSQKESTEKAAQALVQPIHILVNNAGITRDKSFVKMTHEDWDSVIATNLTGLFNVTKACFEKFHATSKSKRIINIASIVALYGNFGQTNYVAAKAGVIGMTKTWAKEFGKKGFTVNAVAPGFIKTSMVEAMPEEVLAQMTAKIPVHRIGETADIANAVLFLASEQAGYINGATISVDGGLVIG